MDVFLLTKQNCLIMWGKYGLGAINGLHKTGVSPQAGHPHWYATQVSCFWTHSIHCHFDSNYNCNLGLLNDLWTMLNDRTVISLLWWEESLGTDFPPPQHVTGIIPAWVSFPYFVLFLLHVSSFFPPEQISLLGPLESDVKISAGFQAQKSFERNSVSTKSLAMKWLAHLCSVPT